MTSRGATADEVNQTIAEGERFPAKHGRRGFRRNFPGEVQWRGKLFNGKQIEVYAVVEDETITVITVIVKYLSEVSQ